MTRPESWASGIAYEPFIGRWSRLLAPEFVQWLDRPAGLRWLDVGCGTGALSHAIGQRAAPALVFAADRSAAYVGYARSHAGSGAVYFLVADATCLPIRPATADVVVSGLLLNFLSDPPRAVAALAGLVGAGGTVAAYVWDYAGRMELLRVFWEAAVDLDPAAAELDEGRRFPVCQPRELERVWLDAGLEGIRCAGIEVETAFRDFEDLWQPFLGGQGPAPAYVASRDSRQRAALRDCLRLRVPAGTDGAIRLRARAWAVCGRRVD